MQSSACCDIIKMYGNTNKCFKFRRCIPMKRLGATFVAMLMTVMFSITSFAGTDFSDNWRYDQSSYTWYYYENGAPATNALHKSPMLLNPPSAIINPPT